MRNNAAGDRTSLKKPTAVVHFWVGASALHRHPNSEGQQVGNQEAACKPETFANFSLPWLGQMWKSLEHSQLMWFQRFFFVNFYSEHEHNLTSIFFFGDWFFQHSEEWRNESEPPLYIYDYMNEIPYSAQCTSIKIYTCINVYVYIYIYVNIKYMYIYICIYVYICTYICIYMYIYMYIYIYLYMYIYMYA